MSICLLVVCNTAIVHEIPAIYAVSVKVLERLQDECRQICKS